MKHSGVSLPVPFGLVESGPLIEVTLGPPRVVADALKAAGGQVDQVQARMMIDTGAQMTLIDNTIPEGLGLVPERFHPVIGVSQVPEECPVYRMAISVKMSDHRGEVLVEFESDITGGKSGPMTQQHVGLLGRDFLVNFELRYFGPRGAFELAVPDATVAAVHAQARHAKQSKRARNEKKRRQHRR